MIIELIEINDRIRRALDRRRVDDSIRGLRSRVDRRGELIEEDHIADVIAIVILEEVNHLRVLSQEVDDVRIQVDVIDDIRILRNQRQHPRSPLTTLRHRVIVDVRIILLIDDLFDRCVFR